MNNPTPADRVIYKAKMTIPVQPEDETTLPATDVTDETFGLIAELSSSRQRRDMWKQRAMAAEAERDGALRDLKTVLDRESASTARFDAKMEAIEAERDALKAEVEQIKKLLIASENWRVAYQDGKYKLYSMGGEICDAAAAHLPMSEGPLDRAMRKVIGPPVLFELQHRAESAEAELATIKSQLDAVVGQETPQDAWERGYKEGVTNAGYYATPKERDRIARWLTMPPYTPPLKAGQ
jgi:hypothetical protein